MQTLRQQTLPTDYWTSLAGVDSRVE
jgi:hypothetical protein